MEGWSVLSIGNNALAECGRSIVGRLEAGNFIGVGICDPGLETLACLAHKKMIWPSNVSSKELIFFPFKVVMALFQPYDVVIARLAKVLSFIIPHFRSTLEHDKL